MITVKRLREILARLPDEWEVVAYEGEDIGLSISPPDESDGVWIRARQSDEEDTLVEGLDMGEKLPPKRIGEPWGSGCDA